jgi:A/G-specific adenine glycosylase
MNASEKKRFITVVQTYYTKHGRHDLPWRHTTDPYKIAVSEVMLQQTQVGRVIEKYKEFLKAFPTLQTLANAPLQHVLLLWSGLGYNRRARFLQQMAKVVTHEQSPALSLRRIKAGTLPKTFDELLKLPGIGAYTAGAICAFAYNQPVVMIETNIRTVYLHHFSPSLRSGSSQKTKAGPEGVIEQVSDKALLPLIQATLDHTNPREWYWALMDYGSYLKTQGVRIHRNSAQYKKQATFKGSLREVRGGIMKILTTRSATAIQLQKLTAFEMPRIEAAIQALLKEGIITKKGKQLGIS